MLPTIACVIPTHNRDRLLEKAIVSVLGQELRPTEVWVVDDVGSLATKALVTRFDQPGLPVKYLHLKTANPSAGASRNFGALHCTSQVIGFLDDDDVWDNSFLERCIEEFQKGDVQMVATWTVQVYETSVQAGLRIRRNLRFHDVLAINPGLTGSNFIIEKSVFDGLTGFDERLPVANDLDFLARFLKDEYSYGAVECELVQQVGHSLGQLTTPTERRAKGLELYRSKWSAHLSTVQRRRLSRDIHATRRYAAKTKFGHVYHAAWQIACSSPMQARESLARLLSGRRGIYSRG